VNYHSYYLLGYAAGVDARKNKTLLQSVRKEAEQEAGLQDIPLCFWSDFRLGFLFGYSESEGKNP